MEKYSKTADGLKSWLDEDGKSYPPSVAFSIEPNIFMVVFKYPKMYEILLKHF